MLGFTLAVVPQKQRTTFRREPGPPPLTLKKRPRAVHPSAYRISPKSRVSLAALRSDASSFFEQIRNLTAQRFRDNPLGGVAKRRLPQPEIPHLVKDGDGRWLPALEQ